MFEDVSAEVRQELEWLLEERAQGPAMLQAAAEGHAEPALPDPEPTGDDPRRSLDLEVDVRVNPDPEPKRAEPKTKQKQASHAGAGRERRRNQRGAYDKKVPAFGTRALRVLVARDLSQGGMRVERFSGLEIGDRLHLAIYGAADQEPFLVWATATRDDGAEGMALVFDQVHAQIAEQLEKVVGDLPAVESLHHDEAHAMGSVVTEILES
jgi:hypothetical protein